MTLTYKTFDELLATIESGLETYVENNMIDHSELIREAKYVNADLGLKLKKSKEVTLNVENYKCDLPVDFSSAILMVAFHVKDIKKLGGYSIPGTHIKEYSREELVEKNIVPSNGCLRCDNSCTYLMKSYGEKEIRITELYPVQPAKTSLKRFCDNSLNRKTVSEYSVDIKEQEISTNFKEGEIHLVYLADLVDEEGNLLVLDHELTDKYYEYALKTKVFEKLYFDYNEDVERKYKELRDVLLPKAKGFARNIVETPEYKDMKNYSRRIISDYYNQYMRMFV